MQNNPKFKALLFWIEQQGYTVEQIKNFTSQQAKANWPDIHFIEEEFAVFKKKLHRTLIDTGKENQLATVVEKVKQHLTSEFPNVEFDRIEEKGRPVVRIWLESKPEIEI